MKIIRSKIIPLPRKDIDTDLIIPAEFLTVTDKKGLGRHLFERVKGQDPSFPFNLSQFADAQILVVRENFGCGSSREHAAWALYDWGIRVVIAPSFADIFYNNAMKNGILPVVLPSELVEKILQESAEFGMAMGDEGLVSGDEIVVMDDQGVVVDGVRVDKDGEKVARVKGHKTDAGTSRDYEILVDLQGQTLTLPDGSKHIFEIDQYRKHCLMEGMDDLDYLLENFETIRKFDKKHSKKIFFDTSKL